jgi:signal peptidase II
MPFAKGSPVLRFGAVAALVTLDQWSKLAVFSWLGVSSERYEHNERMLFGTHWLSFSNSCNGGAAFGQFSQFPWILVVGRIAAVLFLSWLLLRADSRPRLVLVAMNLVLAGALGNLIDNLGAGCLVPERPDHPFLGVRDFVLVNLGSLGDFPAFNVADSCITVGACAWILAGFLHKSEPANAAPTEAPSA